LKRLFSKPVDLAFPGAQLRVRDAQDLEHVLGARTAPSPMQIAIMGSLSPDDQRREAARLESIEHRILRSLPQPEGSMSGSLALLAALDLSEVTDDNDWRAIMSAMRSLNPGREDLTRAALGKFANYLASTRELLQAMSASSAAHANAQARPLSPDEAIDTGPRQQLIFNLDHLAGNPQASWSRAPAGAGSDAQPNGFARLPKGEAIEVQMQSHQSLDLLLARYRFHIVSGDSCMLLDENGNDYRLRSGKNVLGRSSQCDVCVDPFFRAVSRKHVIIEASPDATLRVTDISSLGTYLPSAHVDSLLH
jgi:hypothetical protein